jgi:hypothetical protein
MLLEALFPAMTEHRVDLSQYEPMTVDELVEVLRPGTSLPGPAVCRSLSWRRSCCGHSLPTSPPGSAP